MKLTYKELALMLYKDITQVLNKTNQKTNTQKRALNLLNEYLERFLND